MIGRRWEGKSFGLKHAHTIMKSRTNVQKQPIKLAARKAVVWIMSPLMLAFPNYNKSLNYFINLLGPKEIISAQFFTSMSLYTINNYFRINSLKNNFVLDINGNI